MEANAAGTSSGRLTAREDAVATPPMTAQSAGQGIVHLAFHPLDLGGARRADHDRALLVIGVLAQFMDTMGHQVFSPANKGLHGEWGLSPSASAFS